MKKQTCSFEEDYFQKFYPEKVADFDEKGFGQIYNWFKGIFFTIDKYAKISNGKKKYALEFGCALGAASKVLYDFGYNVIATDISSYAIKRARKLSPQITFLKHDIQKPLALYKRKYDLIICLDVIEHLEMPEKAIRNMYQLIDKNGVVICSTPNDYEYEKKVFTHINVKNPHEWKRLFHKAGFKKVETHIMTFLPFFYRIHWRLNFALPFGINSSVACSPVFIIARR